jgi:hypothetical protein
VLALIGVVLLQKSEGGGLGIGGGGGIFRDEPFAFHSRRLGTAGPLDPRFIATGTIDAGSTLRARRQYSRSAETCLALGAAGAALEVTRKEGPDFRPFGFLGDGG